jgi:transposase
MARPVRKYTKEFKQKAVKLALKLPSVSKAAEELGIPLATLHSGINQLKDKPDVAEDGKNKAQNIAALIEENRRLHKELAIAKEEKEILKKAAAYFAQHQK